MTTTVDDVMGWRPAPLSANAKVALSRQIARDVADQIDRRDLTFGDELPSEADLARAYGVNRLTVRQALGDLARQGLITTGRGRRATVAPPPVRYRLQQTAGTSLASAMAEQGLPVVHVAVSVVGADSSEPPLPLDEVGACRRYDCHRVVDGQLWSRTSTWLPAELSPPTWDGSEPLLDTVSRIHHLQIRRAVRSFAAVPATLDDAEALDVPVGTALLRVTGTNVDQHGRIVAVVRHHVLGGRAEYVVNLLE